MQQLSVGFLPTIADFIETVANTRCTTTSSVIGDAVTYLVKAAEVDPGAVGNEARSYAHRMPEILEGDSTVDDASDPPRHGPKPRYTRRLSCYVTQDIYEDLDDLCARADLGRAGMVRLAVDKYLFDQIVGQFKVKVL